MAVDAARTAHGSPNAEDSDARTNAPANAIAPGQQRCDGRIRDGGLVGQDAPVVARPSQQEAGRQQWSTSLLLTLPGMAFARMVCFLDAHSLQQLRCCGAVYRLVVEEMLRVGAARYRVQNAREFLALPLQQRIRDPKAHPLRAPSRHVSTRTESPFSLLEAETLLQLAFLHAKLAMCFRNNGNLLHVGSFVVDSLTTQLLPAEFEGVVESAAAMSAERMMLSPGLRMLTLNCGRILRLPRRRAGKDDAELATHTLGQGHQHSRPVIPGPATSGIASSSSPVARRRARTTDTEGDANMVDGVNGLQVESDPGLRERIDLNHGNNCSLTFNHLRQDLLNGIINFVEDQYTTCCNILRFPPQRAGNAGALVAAEVARLAGNVMLTPHNVCDLHIQGFCVIDDFLDLATVGAVHVHGLEMMARTKAFWARDDVDEAAIEAALPFLMAPAHPATARGDHLIWLNGDHPPGNQAPLKGVLERFTALFEELGSVVKLQGGREAQLAFYPGSGEGYRRHRDAYPDNGGALSDNRRVSGISYCNPKWRPEHGGHLRVWLTHMPGSPVVDIEPLPGRLVLFLSGLLDHEVRPSLAPRVAVTNWFW